MGYATWVLLTESAFSLVKAGRAALQPREMGGRSNQVLQVSDEDGHSCRGLTARS